MTQGKAEKSSFYGRNKGYRYVCTGSFEPPSRVYGYFLEVGAQSSKAELRQDWLLRWQFGSRCLDGGMACTMLVELSCRQQQSVAAQVPRRSRLPDNVPVAFSVAQSIFRASRYRSDSIFLVISFFQREKKSRRRHLLQLTLNFSAVV